MILSDGKHIQGIFVYDPDIEYELGDFVVEGDCLYVCKSGLPVSGSKPSMNPNIFSPYPGDKISTVEEYNSYISNPIGKEDKYISSNVLAGILQEMYFGFGDSGVIKSHVAYSNKKYNLDTQLLGILGKNNGNIEKPLDLIMREPSLNNAYIEISRELPEISYLFPGTKSSMGCLLRQYTYQDLNDLGVIQGSYYTEHRHRIQEIVDFENGLSFYRFTKGTHRASETSTWQFNDTITSWKSLTLSRELLNKIDLINEFYTESQTKLTVEKTNTFVFSELELSSLSSTCILLTRNDDTVYESADRESTAITRTGISDFKKDSLLLTINVLVNLENTNGVYKSYTVTLDTIDTANNDSFVNYYLDDSLVLVTVFEENKIKMTLKSNSSAIGGLEGAVFKSIYYRTRE